MQFSFLWFHIYQASFKFKFNFSVFPDLDRKALRNKKPKTTNNLSALQQNFHGKLLHFLSALNSSNAAWTFNLYKELFQAMGWYKADCNIIPVLNLECWEGQIVFLFGINVSLTIIWRSWPLHSLTCSSGESNTGPILLELICLHLKCSSLQNINIPFQRICSLSSVWPSFMLLLYPVNCTDLVNQQWTFPQLKTKIIHGLPW